MISNHQYFFISLFYYIFSVTNVRIKLPYNERNVRRNLKFTEIPMSATKIKRFAKANMNNTNNNPKKGNVHLSTRKSFLLPPNTIKELHIKNRFKRNRSELSQFRILIDSGNVNPRISETSESCSPLVENTNAHANSIMHMKENKTSIIQSISSQTFNVNEQSGINILHSSHSDLADRSNNVVEKILENLNSNEILNVNTCRSQNSGCNVRLNRSQLSSAGDMRIDMDLYSGNDVDQNNIRCADRDSLMTCILPDARKVKETCFINEKEKLSTTTNIYEDLHSSLQTVKMISESCLNLQHSTKEDESVTLNKAELIILASNLKHLICRLEEDTSNLKLMLTIVTKMLSAINLSKGIKDNETKTKQQMTEVIENLNNNTKVIDNMDTKLPCIMITNIDTECDNILKETCKTPDINRSKFLETNEKNNPQPSDQMYVASGSNKENKEILNSPIIKQDFKSKTRRHSARLMAKVLNNLNVTNDSFVNLENELDIVNIKCNTPITPLINHTSTKNKYKDKKIGRPLKEYMALKSRMSCLLTPNIKQFNSSESKNKIHRETNDTNDTRTSLSDKLLMELYNLYGDSLDV